MRKKHDSLTPQLAKVAGLYSDKARRTHGQVIAEGPQAAREALTHGRDRVRDVYLTEARDTEFTGLTGGVWTHVIPGEIMARISGTCQGIIVVLDASAPASLDILAGAGLAVLAAEMQDPGNAGTLIRTADAAGCAAVIFGRGGVNPASPKVVRSAAGSTFHLPVIANADPLAVMTRARAEGMVVRAADARGETSIASLEPAPTLWVIGNEARGLTDEIRASCDELVSIPILGQAESLNASIAAALCLYAGIIKGE